MPMPWYIIFMMTAERNAFWTVGKTWALVRGDGETVRQASGWRSYCYRSSHDRESGVTGGGRSLGITLRHLDFVPLRTKWLFHISISIHVWMWELDHKEGWVPKNWCFWTVVLEKTFESPLDCKEFKPVNPKGNRSWIIIGRTDAEAEAPILWPDRKSVV